jgi:hypothetical protein
MALDPTHLLQATEQHVQQIVAGNDASHDYSHIGVSKPIDTDTSYTERCLYYAGHYKLNLHNPE